MSPHNIKTLERMSDVESKSPAYWLTTDWYPDDLSRWSKRDLEGARWSEAGEMVITTLGQP